VLTASEVPAALRASASTAFDLANELVESGEDLGPLEDLVDRSFRSSNSVVTAALLDLGGAPATSLARPSSSCHNRRHWAELVEAIRCLVEMTAEAVSVAPTPRFIV
jgi:hypothetical protein